jgi:hypothetical protein
MIMLLNVELLDYRLGVVYHHFDSDFVDSLGPAVVWSGEAGVHVQVAEVFTGTE